MKKIDELRHSFLLWNQSPEEHPLHPTDIAYYFRFLYDDNREEFFAAIKSIDSETLGDVLLELPEKIEDEAISFLSPKELAEAVEALESDDGTDLVQDIEELDEEKSEIVVSHLDKDSQEDIGILKRYHEDQAGALMQVELFEARLDESVQAAVDRLREQKANGDLENVYQLFVTDETRRLKASIPLEDLILFDFSKTFELIIKEGSFETKRVNAIDNVDEVSKIIEQYDLPVIPVVDWQDRIVGRITTDDIYDVLEEQATEQIYNLAGVDDDAESENMLSGVVRKRGIWLFVNLITAIIASVVISLFDTTLQALIPLAILMPIVASMGGNAGTQALTVMVRQIALGEIEFVNAKRAVQKEIFVAMLNGFVFAIVMGIVAALWFKIPLLGVVIGLAMLINLLAAGFFGAAIPLLLKRLQVDPAVGSTVILTTVTDVVGFFSFLGLAKIMILS